MPATGENKDSSDESIKLYGNNSPRKKKKKKLFLSSFYDFINFYNNLFF